MAKDTEKKPPKEKKKRSRAAAILWSFTGVLVLLLGALAFTFFQFPGILEDLLGEAQVEEFRELITGPADQDDAGSAKNIGKETAATDRRDRKARKADRDGLAMEGERSHQVQPGESLWGIAKMGELVDNPWEWRTILLQNADKIDYAFISSEDIAEGKGAWKVMLAVGQELTVIQPPMSEYSGKMKGRKWLFQLAAVSENNGNKAITVVRTLMRDGYYANLERFVQGDKIWYRIRSGFYDNEEDAWEIAEEIRERYLDENLFPHTPRVFLASKEERSGSGMIFGAQLANPWAVEFARRDSHREALLDLRRVKGSGKLAYIWQTLDAPDGPYIYQVRIGFFGSEEEAGEVIAGKNKGIWEDARSIRIESLVESLPGQPHKLGNISF